MSVWTPLAEADWHAHPLNSRRGGFRWVIGWIGFQTVLALVLTALLVTMPQELFDPAIPDSFEWAQWIFLVAGPPVVFAMLLTRHPATALLYGVYVVVVLAFSFYAEGWAPFLTAAETYRTAAGLAGAGAFAFFTTADFLALWFLTQSPRANVVLRRRVRHAG